MSEANARDAGLERLLRSALRRPPPGGVDACPDPGLLAAFVEGELTATDERVLDTHIAACGRCQETLAEIGLALPDDGVEEEVRPRASSWFTWAARPRLRWLVPISAAATVAVVFFATRPLVAPDAIAPAIELTRADEAARGAAASIEPAKPQEPSRQATTAQAAPERADELSRGKGDAKPEAEMLASRIATEEKAAPPSVAAPAAAPPVAAADAASKEAAADKPRAGPLTAAKRDELLTQLRTLESTATVIAASDRKVRWQLGPAGRIWRSLDGGETWKEQLSSVSANLVAGSAPSATTCWAVGTAGTVLLTTDGERWERRPFPLAADLTAVDASSARSATVTTRDGQRFETLDAGRTWFPKKSQTRFR